MSTAVPTTMEEAVVALGDGSGNRRSACDRCRGRKLRCERSPGAIRCRRCTRANVQCVTGAALKSGRPLQLPGLFRRQQNLDQEDGGVQTCAQWNSSQAILDVSMPSQIDLETRPETLPNQDYEGDLDFRILDSPGGVYGWDDLWAGTTSSLDVPSMSLTGGNQYGHEVPLTPPSDRRNQCLEKLGDLQKAVLVDLEAVKACKTADKCPQAGLSFDEDQPHNFLIGRMLSHSSALIEILNCFNPISKAVTRQPCGHGSGTTEASHSGLRCDAPTMFSLLSCYVCLTRIYRTVFSCIHDSIPFLKGLQQPGHQLFPGMNLGGFKLSSRLDLQVQILVQVSEDMLSRIEARFGLSGDASAAHVCIFDHGKITKMLRMMLEEEAGEQPQLDEPRGDCESLRDILRSLKRLIMVKDTVQLDVG
ncbi:hypothetical protein ASPZODRAFT_18451 [Penicilliopsis zonata CBS 506.65]|uniref:Zn(2)-C6 fungal-type domain-containing protein n=1 Tax=Penicilliopsis zonata CBS 506.65 TaxID=1073090 RepID=A0A1L9SAS7_9EURO|nr:hypothetical protein ASPZODRAFT_18451 [Penicilliopsis zonata CBS 506.65]OJJ44258.1 hypothetical protein ASPZODRAFT_18451 [Penicilliopsis zonata CBS 506.65]